MINFRAALLTQQWSDALTPLERRHRMKQMLVYDSAHISGKLKSRVSPYAELCYRVNLAL
jgi:hypothetical protein